jgi:hypothetical protein
MISSILSNAPSPCFFLNKGSLILSLEEPLSWRGKSCIGKLFSGKSILRTPGGPQTPVGPQLPLFIVDHYITIVGRKRPRARPKHDVADNKMPGERLSKVTFEGRDYTVKDSTRLHHRYRCSTFRATGCRATLNVEIDSGKLVLKNATHTCDSKVIQEAGAIDIKEEMKRRARELALENHGMSAGKVWHTVCREVDDKNASTTGLVIKEKKATILNLVSNARAEFGGISAIHHMKSPRYAHIGLGDERLFLKVCFDYELPTETAAKQYMMQSMLIWAHPDLLPILRRRGIAAFIDGTFRSVPKPYTQCIIIMCFDDETGTYVPIIFALVDNKTQWGYWHLLHFVLTITSMKFCPATITCDFEKALILAIHEQFPETMVIGCLFHFKQALRRKLVKLGISAETISFAMRKNMLDSLTTTPLKQIDDRISELRRLIPECEQKEKWDQFYAYFSKTWQHDFNFDDWNISSANANGIHIQNRTNNALENLNRQINSAFSTPHPNIYNFIDTIREISCQKWRDLQSKRSTTSQ